MEGFFVQLSGISENTFDYSSQMYTPYKIPSIDVGYVSQPVYLEFFVNNATRAPKTLAELLEDQGTGIEFDSIEVGDIVPAYSSIRVLVTISQYGPIEFSATYNFVSSLCSILSILTLIGTRPLFSTDQPRPIALEDALGEIYSNPSGDETFYDTLEFIELSSGDSVKIVHSDEDLETPQGTFTACKFECQHPETEGGIVGALQITVDFLPLSAKRWIHEKSKTGTGISTYWRQYLGPNMEPDAHYPLPLDITNVEQTMTGATITASFPLLTAMKFPRRLMTTTVLPGGIT